MRMSKQGDYICTKYKDWGLEGKRRRKIHPNNDWNASAVQNKTPGKTKLYLGLWLKGTDNGIKSFCFQAAGEPNPG